MIAPSVTTQTSTPAAKGQRLDMKKNSNKEGFSSLLGFENAEVTKPVETNVPPVARNLKAPVTDQMISKEPKITDDSEVDSLGQRSAMQKFIFKMESELGVKPSKILEAFADLDPEELQKSPRETMNLVIDNLGLSPQQVPVAKQYFQELLDQTESQELQSVVKSGDRRLTLEVLSQKELRQKALERSLERMNQNFFAQPVYKHPTMSASNGQNLPSATMSNLNALGNQETTNPAQLNAETEVESVPNSESSEQNNEFALEGPKNSGFETEGLQSSSSHAGSAVAASLAALASPMKSTPGANATSAEAAGKPSSQKLKAKDLSIGENVADVSKSIFSESVPSLQNASSSRLGINSNFGLGVTPQVFKGNDLSGDQSESEDFDLSSLGLENGSVDSNIQINSDGMGSRKQLVSAENLNFAQIQQELAAIKSGNSSPMSQNLAASVQTQSAAGISANNFTDNSDQESDSQENLQQQDTAIRADGSTQKLNLESKNPEFVMANRPTESQHAQNVKTISEQADLMVQKGGGEIKVRLQPEGLGEILLKVRTKGANVHLEMVAENSEAKRLIENGLSDLKANLAHHKLSVENVKVEVASQIQTQLENQQKEQERQFSQQFMQDFSRKNQEWRQAFYDLPGARNLPSQIDDGQAEKIRTLSARSNNDKSSRRLNLVA